MARRCEGIYLFSDDLRVVQCKRTRRRFVITIFFFANRARRFLTRLNGIKHSWMNDPFGILKRAASFSLPLRTGHQQPDETFSASPHAGNVLITRAVLRAIRSHRLYYCATDAPRVFFLLEFLRTDNNERLRLRGIDDDNKTPAEYIYLLLFLLTLRRYRNRRCKLYIPPDRFAKIVFYVR